jgi:uncharacterized protein YjbK
MLLVVPGRSPSWNKIYTVNSYWTRKAIVDGIHALVVQALLTQKIPKQIYEKRVTIRVIAYFKHRPIDSDNIPAKIYLDPLKSWLLKNDDITCVGAVTTESIIDKTHPERVEITITLDS